MQRLWLTVESLGLSLQPVTGTIFLQHSLKRGLLKIVSEKNQIELNDAYAIIEQEFCAKGKTIGMTFRIGKAPIASDKSSRLEPKITYRNDFS
jgi:hypothetical protein